MPDKQIVRVTFEQIDGEEIGAAGYAITSIVGHWGTYFEVASEQGYTREYNRWRIEPPVRHKLSDRRSCGAIREYAIAPYAGWGEWQADTIEAAVAFIQGRTEAVGTPRPFRPKQQNEFEPVSAPFPHLVGLSRYARSPSTLGKMQPRLGRASSPVGRPVFKTG